MEIALRIMTGATITGLVLFGLAVPYTLLTGRYVWGIVVAIAATLLVLATKRIGNFCHCFAIGNAVIGVIIGLCLIVNSLPYRATSAKWGLTPGTLQTQFVFGIIYVVAGIAGGFLGSYVPILKHSGKR